MAQTLTPMLHVPDVAATIDWYLGIGFTLLDRGEAEGETVWAELAFGSGVVMLSAGGEPGGAERRDADLYLRVDGVDTWFERVARRAEVIEGLHQTFYGMREFLIRDCNGFWITFGEPAGSAVH